MSAESKAQIQIKANLKRKEVGVKRLVSVLSHSRLCTLNHCLGEIANHCPLDSNLASISQDSNQSILNDTELNKLNEIFQPCTQRPNVSFEKQREGVLRKQAKMEAAHKLIYHMLLYKESRGKL